VVLQEMFTDEVKGDEMTLDETLEAIRTCWREYTQALNDADIAYRTTKAVADQALGDAAKRCRDQVAQADEEFNIQRIRLCFEWEKGLHR
jgi:hypothetical protein